MLDTENQIEVELAVTVANVVVVAVTGIPTKFVEDSDQLLAMFLYVGAFYVDMMPTDHPDIACPLIKEMCTAMGLPCHAFSCSAEPWVYSRDQKFGEITVDKVIVRELVALEALDLCLGLWIVSIEGLPVLLGLGAFGFV